MAELDLTVAGRSYRLACADGEERHLLSLAAMLDVEARNLAAQGGVLSEARLLLMTALMIADRLHEAESRLEAAPEAAPQPPTASPEDADLAEEAAALGAAADRLEALIGRLESGEPARLL